MIELANQSPLFVGLRRMVYRHPLEPDLLIKVIRADALEQRWDTAPWYRRLTRTGPYVVYMREFREYLASYRYAPEHISPLVRIVGVIETDMGLGLINEKVVDETGAIAPTLGSLAAQGALTKAMEAALERFLEELLRHNIITSDLHADNLIYGSDSRGGPRVIMIDGFGEKNIIPICSMSRAHNARRTKAKFKKIRAHLYDLQRRSQSSNERAGFDGHD